MKRLLWVPVMALVLGIALLNGCGEKTDQAAQKAKEQIQEAAETAGAWTKDQMNNYIGEMKEQLGNLDSQLEEFNAKAEGLDDAAKEKYQEQLAALDEKKDAVAKKNGRINNGQRRRLGKGQGGAGQVDGRTGAAL